MAGGSSSAGKDIATLAWVAEQEQRETLSLLGRFGQQKRLLVDALTTVTLEAAG